MANSQNSQRRKKALGRGLGALIPKQPQTSGSEKEYFECELDKIIPNADQPRKHFDPDALSDLSTSIKESGLIQPLVVRKMDGDEERYELIAGERRWRASRMAGLTSVPVVVKVVDDAIAFALALIENIQRQELNPVEEALAYQRLIEEFEFKQAELAEQVGKSRSAISNSIRLLNLPQDILDLLADGSLTSGHARALLTLDETEAMLLAGVIVDEQLTVRQTEDRARNIKDGSETAADVVASFADTAEQNLADAALADLEEELEQPDAITPVEDALPEEEAVSFTAAALREDKTTETITARLSKAFETTVQLRDRHDKGHIQIHYDDYDALRRIMELLDLDDGLDL
ncbi:MAG: ParB/RepB/Spo0J family partition protein [Myxococcota bacterium]|nr:ParB/RepB/Spo0J family partition protein [Myxococcota bacterium]